jgi:hypothetical protein
VVRFEVANLPFTPTPAIYLHDTRPAEGNDREVCDVCAGGSHDTAYGQRAALNLIRLDAWFNGETLDPRRTTHLSRLELALAA